MTAARTIRRPWRFKMSRHLRWYSVGQAAQYLGLEETTIERMLKDGRLHATVIPGEARPWQRIPREELEAIRVEMERGLALSQQAGSR